jgi:hypothetical protein
VEISARSSDVDLRTLVVLCNQQDRWASARQRGLDRLAEHPRNVRRAIGSLRPGRGSSKNGSRVDGAIAPTRVLKRTSALHVRRGLANDGQERNMGRSGLRHRMNEIHGAAP